VTLNDLFVKRSFKKTQHLRLLRSTATAFSRFPTVLIQPEVVVGSSCITIVEASFSLINNGMGSLYNALPTVCIKDYKFLDIKQITLIQGENRQSQALTIIGKTAMVKDP